MNLAPCVGVAVDVALMVVGVVAAVAVWAATVAGQRLGMAERVTRSGGRMLRALADLVAGR